jgi:hypothetical protein
LGTWACSTNRQLEAVPLPTSSVPEA